jgi:hypothetical protein
VKHDGLQRAQLTQQVERLCGPAGHEVEPSAVAAALRLDVNGARLVVERELRGTGRFGGEKQDHMLRG